ncbi:DUF2528 family protein [Yersinia pekkanenii]|uniref:Protein of uncharacterized function (DUF2528) n=1 Tax=Yersinia pekkanenii TaxID=1288385 RepID=A0A0T9R6F0_9GAMM|nr:DUF2528 family protein [Yersinia pekkanenii]CNI46382.1 Protein of uncharacterised function (DUF2528) [Yersinia pekkanenii]CRY65735.1 Protein of uncharacterised function (DUF2528) [Yersinia pekkanenii]
MNNKKTYRIDWDWKAEIDVEIDHDVMTDENLHGINNFFYGAEERLRDSGLVLHAVLKMLAETCLRLQVEYSYNTHGMISLFDWDDATLNGGIEGWPCMNGSEGIRLVGVDSVSFDYSDMSVKNLTTD